MRYSIIIPTLNEEKLLPKLLKQFNNELRNKYNIEIIISDGGSSDNTIPIALENNTKIIAHTKSKKQNIAVGRNDGASIAEGEILIFLNGDIFIKEIDTFFNYINNKFIKSEFLAMTCKVKIFPEEEIFFDKIFHWFYNYYFYFLNIIGIGMGRGECQIIRKEIFNSVNGFNPELAAGEDFDLFRRIRKKGKILFANNLIVYESPRRYRKLGYINVVFSWTQNAFSVFFNNRSISKEWEEVR